MLWVSVCAAAVGAALYDLREGRVPNWLTFGAMALGLLLRPVGVLPGGISSAVGGALLGFTFFCIPYSLGLMGAGDVKLLMAFGALGGPFFCIKTCLYGSILGGAFAFGLLAKKRGFLGALRYSAKCFAIVAGGEKPESELGAFLPYAAFISAGAVLALFGGGGGS